eukprot:Amastigsp_a841034_169.p1 type:complete len:371 gc:universal Amastigsp_a841034_169:1441-329(-)
MATAGLPKDCLNCAWPLHGFAVPRPADIASAELLASLLEIFVGATDEPHHRVDADVLRRIAASEPFREFEGACGELAFCSLEGTSDETRARVFLNVYHLLLLHGLVVLGEVPRSTRKRLALYSRWRYAIGPVVATCAQIEHALLRAPLSRPDILGAMLLPRFEGDHPGAAFALRRAIPQISFALCSGAASGARLRVFFPGDSKAFESFFQDAERRYLMEHVSVRGPVGRRVVALPRLLKWFAADFVPASVKPTKRAVLAAIAPALCGVVQLEVQALIEAGLGEGGIEWAPYDWAMLHFYASDGLAPSRWPLSGRVAAGGRAGASASAGPSGIFLLLDATDTSTATTEEADDDEAFAVMRGESIDDSVAQL